MESTRKRDPAGRFDGVRWNVEDVPRLPTFLARWVLEDPRQRPYLVYWAPTNGPAFALKMTPAEDGLAVVTTLENGEAHRISVLRRRLPRGTGGALFYICPSCQRPRRFLYLLAMSGTTLVASRGLLCQRCANLRFVSQRANAVRYAPSDPRLIAEDLAPAGN
jgi:hypothetical protein